MFTTNRNALFSSALPWLVGKIARGKTVNSGLGNALLAPAQYTNLVFLSVATALFPGEQHHPQPEEHGYGHECGAGESERADRSHHSEGKREYKAVSLGPHFKHIILCI